VDQASKARAQRRRQIPTGLRQADRLGDLLVAVSLEGEQDDGGALPEPRGSGDGVPQVRRISC